MRRKPGQVGIEGKLWFNRADVDWIQYGGSWFRLAPTEEHPRRVLAIRLDVNEHRSPKEPWNAVATAVTIDEPLEVSPDVLQSDDLPTTAERAAWREALADPMFVIDIADAYIRHWGMHGPLGGDEYTGAPQRARIQAVRSLIGG